MKPGKMPIARQGEAPLAMEDKVNKLCEAFGDLAHNWNPERLKQRIEDIRRYYRSNSDIVPLSKRRKIARNAKALLQSLEDARGPDSASLCGLDPAFWDTLRDLGTPGWRTGLQHLQQPGKGRMLKGSLAAMIVRLHIEAHEKPEYGATLIAFAKAIYDFLEIPKKEQPANETLHAEFTDLKAKFMADKTRVLVRRKFDPTVKSLWLKDLA